MRSADYAIQIIPDLTIDHKYASIIGEATGRLESFTSNALRDDRLKELFHLNRTGVQESFAQEVLTQEGRLVAGFQFDNRSEGVDDTFTVFCRKVTKSGQAVKFHLTPTVQEIVLQLISLEDRRTVAIFSMLNSSMEIGSRILSTLYTTQLQRLIHRAPPFVREEIAEKLERLEMANAMEDDLWQEKDGTSERTSRTPGADRQQSQDNILQVMADESTFAEINQYVENVISRAAHIRDKRLRLEQNPDMSKDRFYQEMVMEDMDQLENCYARIHIYMKTFYKKQKKRTSERNKILRQFFGGQIETISAETSLLEDLLSLSQAEYFKNIERHQELD